MLLCLKDNLVVVPGDYIDGFGIHLWMDTIYR